MPQQVNRVPPGLISLLGIKGSGQNPQLLADLITPTLDVTQAYLAGFSDRLQVDTAAVTARGILGSSGQLSPGPGEIFAVNECVAVNLGAAASTLRIRLCLYDTGTGNIFAASPDAASSAANEWAISAWHGPLYVPSGFDLGVVVESFTGTPGTIRLAAMFTRLRV